MKKSLSKQIMLLSFFSVFFSTNLLQSQVTHGISKVPNSPNNENNYDKPKLYDRFGNEFAIEELRFKKTPSNNPIPTGYPLWLPPPVTMLPCNAGLFNIEFAPESLPTAGFFNAAYRNVVCQVFRDISRLFYNVDTNNTTRVNILVSSEQALPNYFSGSTMPSGIDVVGSGFELVQPSMHNAFIDNTIYTTIRSGKSAYYNLEHFSQYKAYDYFHGYMAVRLNGKNWFTNLTAKNITTTQDDLYSAILSEALHMLGLYSQISHNGNSVMGNNLYSRYDNFLFKNTTANKVISQNSISFIITKNVTNLALGCTSPNNIIFNGNSLVNQSVYTSSLWQTGANLSHFGCSGSTPCNAGNALPSNTYTMIPCRGLGANYFKRYPHQNEVKALCDLGYKLKVDGSGFTNYGESDWNDSTYGNIFKSYSSCTEPCVAVGKHDTFYRPYYSTFTINFSSVLSNDFPTSAVIGRLSLLDTNLGTLTINATSFTFVPKQGRYTDRVSFVYFPRCNAGSDLGNATFVTVYYKYTPQLPCENIDSPNCNYICTGTFEEVDDPNEWCNFAVLNSSTINTVDLYRYYGPESVYRNHVSNLWQRNGIPGCRRIMDIRPSYRGGNHYVGLEGTNDNSEGLHFKLRKPITNIDTTKKYRIRFQGTIGSPVCPTVPIMIFGGDSTPLPRPNALFDWTPFKCNQSICPLLASTTITYGLPAWNEYDLPINFGLTPDTISDIVVCINLDTIKIDGPDRYAYLDNFEIYEDTRQKINITTIYSPSYSCSDSLREVKFAVCMKHNTSNNSDTVLVHLNLPAGITVDTGSDFNSMGVYKFLPNTILGSICDTLTLRYKVASYALHFSSKFEIGIGYSTNAYCNEDKSDIFKLYPTDNSLTFLKTASKMYPSVGDTITFNIQICNPSTLGITGLNLIDEIPHGIKLISHPGMNLVNANTLQQLFDISPAVSSTQPSCINFTFKGISMSSCRIPTKAVLTSIYNPCNELLSILNLNDTIIDTLPRASIIPVNFVWCDSAVPLKVVDNSSTFTYQWYRNDTLISGATSRIYAASPAAQYSVKVSNNGCITKVDAPFFDTTYTVDYVTTDATCTSATGSISISPKKGIPPFSYNWSGSSVTNGVRNNIIGGNYAVTITDSIGCSKSLIINVGVRLDTMKVVYDSLILPYCTAANGKIYSTPSKGTAPYSYLWNDGITQEDRFDIKKSSYKLTITDFHGCELTDSFNIPSSDYTIQVTSSIVHAACNTNTGAIYISPNTGTAPYHYLWSTGETTRDRLGLSPDTFFILVSDTFGCQGVDSFIVNRLDSFIHLIDTVIYPRCFGDVNGSISLNPQGGTAPYNYLWNNGTTLQKRTSLPSGSYSVTITDVNGCRAEREYSFQNPPEIYATGYGCYSYCDTPTGCAGMTVISGRAPYKYLWADGDTATYRTNLPIGDYPLYIRDSAGCTSALFSYYVDNLGSYNWTNANMIETIYHRCSSTIDLKAISIPYYDYWWSTGVSSNILQNISAGDTFILYMYDTAGSNCYFIDTIIPLGKLDIGLGTMYPNASSLITLLSDITTFPGYNYISHQCFNVVGDFDIDVNMWFDNCTFEIESGKGIYHTSTGMELILRSCQFYSCGAELWHGIVCDFNTYTSIYDCKIEDAYYGLEVGRADINVSNTDFNYNFVGIYFSPDPSFNYQPNFTTSWYNIQGCNFIGHHNKQIKNPYSGIQFTGAYSLQHPSPNYLNTSWAGIIAADRILSIPANCSFRNLVNGILTHNVQSSHCTHISFDSINGINSIGNSAVNGVCFYGNSNITHPWIRPRHTIFSWNPSATVSSTFKNSDIGVKIDNSAHIQMEKASMENVKSGLEATNLWSTILNHNNISSSDKGIKVVNFNTALHSCIDRGPSFPCKPGIYNNTIVNTGTNNAHGAIELQHTNWIDTFYYNYTVAENTIDLHGRNGFGVYVANLKANDTQSHSRISLNQLFIHDPSSTSRGMHFVNNNNMRISLNQVASTNPNASFVATQSPIAMHFEKTEANIICNEVNNTHLGMAFTDLCTKTNFEKNHFQDHYGGLVLDGSSFLQSQNNKGNTWTGSYGAMTAARNDQSFLNTTFQVGNSAPLECTPPSRQPLAFFTFGGSGDNPSCVDVTYSTPPQGYDGAYLQQQSADYPEYNTALNYQREAELYRDLKVIEPSLAPNSAEKNYINQRANSNIDRFLNIEKQANQLLELSPSEKLQYDILDYQAHGYMDSLRKLHAEFNTVPHSQQQSLRQSISSLTQALYMTRVHKHQLLDPVYQAALSASNQLIQLNEAIEPINLSERLQKQFNALYLPTYALGNTTLSAQQKEEFRILANQCPRINGDVVFRSRAILSAQEASVYYDDNYICDTTSHSVKHEPPSNAIDSPYCTFAPNPAHTQALISFRTIPNEELIIRMVTLEGITVYESTNYVSSETYSIPTMNLQDGLYLLQIVSVQNNETLFGGQIQILHE